MFRSPISVPENRCMRKQDGSSFKEEITLASIRGTRGGTKAKENTNEASTQGSSPSADQD